MLDVAALPIALVIALVVAVGLLALPLEIAFHFEGRNTIAGELVVRAVFGLLRFRVRFPSEPSRRPRGRRASRAAAAPAPRAQRGQPDVLAVLRQTAFRRRVVRLVRDVTAAVQVRRLDVHLRVGLGDPSDTGRLWAMVAPLVWLVPRPRNAQMRIEPDFEDAVCTLLANGRLVLYPLQLAALAVGFVLAPASLRAWRSLRSSRERPGSTD